MSKKLQKFECKLESQFIECTCSICKNIVSEPHQVTCCGAVSCRICIESQKEANKPCWSCMFDDYDSVPDVRFDRTRVICPRTYKGCQWKGEFRRLKEHLNLEPNPDRQLKGCPFYKVRCLYCNEFFRRSQVKDHQSKICLKRPFTCEHCTTYKSTYEDVKRNHEAKCGEFIISCPNGCKEKLFRSEIKSHQMTCREVEIDCDYKFAGCTVRMLRKKRISHMKEYVLAHRGMKEKYDVEKEKHENVHVAKLQAELGELKQSVEILRGSPPICPVKLTLSNFSWYEERNEIWYSSPFCTDIHGYTLCLKVSFGQRENGGGRFLTLNLHLMKGKFDDQLQWPIKADFEVKLLKWGVEEGHHSTTIKFDDNTPQECSLRVTDVERAAKGVECKNFISLAELKRINSNYLHVQEDKCCFRITKRDLLDLCP